MSTLYRPEVSFVAQVDYGVSENVSPPCKINRDGVLVTSNKFGFVYFAVKNQLFVTSIASIESKFDGGDDTHEFSSLHPTVFSTTQDITEISLSFSELLLAVCCGSNIFLCDTRQLSSPNVNFFLFSLSF